MNINNKSAQQLKEAEAEIAGCLPAGQSSSWCKIFQFKAAKHRHSEHTKLQTDIIVSRVGFSASKSSASNRYKALAAALYKAESIK